VGAGEQLTVAARTRLSFRHARLVQSRQTRGHDPPKENAMSQELVLDGQLEDQKQFARILYVVHAITFLFSLGLLSFLPLIANYIKRPDTTGTVVYTHHSWMIRSFWIYIICMAVAVMIAIFTLGLGLPVAWLVGALAWLWKAYRLVRGFIDLNSNRAMPA
jgi:uncharacterized membrane protein